MRAGWRAAGDVHFLQGADELGKAGGGLVQISDRADNSVFACQPAADRPMEGITGSGDAERQRNRNCERQMRGKAREPEAFLLHLQGSAAKTGQTHGHVISQPVDGVVRAGRQDGFKRKAGPGRKLFRDQAVYERLVNIKLVVMHPCDRHRYPAPILNTFVF